MRKAIRTVALWVLPMALVIGWTLPVSAQERTPSSAGAVSLRAEQPASPGGETREPSDKIAASVYSPAEERAAAIRTGTGAALVGLGVAMEAIGTGSFVMARRNGSRADYNLGTGLCAAGAAALVAGVVLIEWPMKKTSAAQASPRLALGLTGAGGRQGAWTGVFW